MSSRSRERFMRHRRGPFGFALPVISQEELRALTPEGMTERYAHFIRVRCLPFSGKSGA